MNHITARELHDDRPAPRNGEQIEQTDVVAAGGRGAIDAEGIRGVDE
ncbi:MAG: hypothetical protein LC791_11420 [Acidobacteria bacterium]|nr:hypothetical protein [Acidobacteriota bacterium]